MSGENKDGSQGSLMKKATGKRQWPSFGFNCPAAGQLAPCLSGCLDQLDALGTQVSPLFV